MISIPSSTTSKPKRAPVDPATAEAARVVLRERVDAAKTALAEKSLRAFVKQAWSTVEPGKVYKHNWHIDAISEHLQAVTEGQIRKLIINVPPRHMKSLCTAVMWPVWEWINNPAEQWLFATYAQTLSIRDSVKRRRLITSPWYQSRWGDRFKLAGDQNAKIRFDNDAQGYMLATSVGGALTGEGGNKIVVDDPHNAIEGESEAVRETTLEWWDMALSTRLNDPMTGSYVIIMQRIHELDLVGHILAREHGWDHLCLPAEYESDHPTPCKTILDFRDPRTKDGELLWPNRVPRTELEDLKLKLGSRGTAGQLQQRPSPAGGDIFRRDWFSYWKHTHKAHIGRIEVTDPNGPRWTNGKVYSLEGGRRFITVDGALSEKTAADSTVISAWCLTQGTLFLLDVQSGKYTAPEIPAAIRASMARNQTNEVHVEVDGGGLAIYQNCVAAGLPVREFHAKKWGDKETRAHTVTPYMEQGKIVFMADAPWLATFEHQLLIFPNGAHDDEVDTLTSAGIVAFHTGGTTMAGVNKAETKKPRRVDILDGVAPRGAW